MAGSYRLPVSPSRNFSATVSKCTAGCGLQLLEVGWTKPTRSVVRDHQLGKKIPMSDVADKAVTNMAAITVKNLAEGRVQDADPQVKAAADACASSTNSLLAIADTAKGKMDEIAHREQRGELPRAGADTLRREVQQEAQSLSREAQRQYEASHKDATELAVTTALPHVVQERESLSRQEMMLALGDAQGPDVVSRFFGVINGGSDEAKAVLLNSSFGRQALISKGVKDVDELLAKGKLVAAEQDETVAVTLEKLEKLNTAFQAGTKVVDFSLGL